MQDFDISKMDFQQLKNYYAVYLLEQLMEGGGKGFKSGLHMAFGAAIQWKEMQDKKKKSGGKNL
jgi:hypothetical protein